MSENERMRRSIISAVAGAVILAVIVLSPLVLLALGSLGPENWSRLSDIGQAYGFTSALLSAIALAFVSITMAHQFKQNRVAHLQAFRGMQADIMGLLTSDPDAYMPCYGARTAEEMLATRQAIFCSLRSRYMLAGMELGEWDEYLIRNEFAPEVYGNEISRRWWSAASIHYKRKAASRTEKTLARILDEEVAGYLAKSMGGESTGRDADRVMLEIIREDILKGRSGRESTSSSVTPCDERIADPSKE
ncbi:DUF6082 family protein [Actinoplanes sp. NPDC049668]|uniref:DUF6082 family protein n=1 Tax=unclassified Actinoplanes TaxID=2626549 RepID=UPI0033A28B51